MKTKLILAILLICMAGLLFGSENPADMDEMQRRTQELKALSERFKADKGFEGVIETNTEVMKLSHFRGNFKDIDMSGVSDTLAFRQVCNRIISKLLPYIGAKENQLDAGKISISSTSIRTQYQQRVNGYPIEGAGRLVVSYEKDYNRISILNVTVDITPKVLEVKLTEEQAIRIAIEKHVPTYNLSAKKPLIRLAVTNDIVSQSGEYYLCYIIGFSKLTVCVDAYTGDIRYTSSRMMNSYSCQVQGIVYDPYYTSSPINLLGTKPMSNVCVSTSNFADYTNANGSLILIDSSLDDLSSTLTMQDTYSYSLVVFPDTLATKQADSILVTGNHIEVMYSDNSHKSANQYYHISKQREALNSLLSFQPNMLTIKANYPIVSGGFFDINDNSIGISHNSGDYSHVAMHELNHSFVVETLNGHFFDDTTDSNKQAMDEAFAVFLQCSVLEYPYCVYGDAMELTSLLGDNSVNYIQGIFDIGVPVNEEYYASYYNRYSVASAWWTLRSNPIFGSPDPITQVKAFDKALVEVLATDVDVSFSDRYKPRYFYNLLMTKYSTDNQTWTLNEKQIAIKDAYNSRGLNFYPKVESISEYSKERNVFGLNEPVHVKISNCPQNTAANIYIVKHNEYTYTDGALLPTLSSHFPSGFSPLTSVVTSPLGEWEGFLWTTAEEGEFDIIVDFGSPSTPDGIIRFSFSGANVMDGFDGRTMPGFRVTGLAGIATNSLNELYTSSLQIAISD